MTRSPPDNATPPTGFSRVLAFLVAVVFALAFGGGGLWAGLLPLADNLRMAWQVRDWQPVPATVLSGRLASKPGKSGPSLSVLAEYEYVYAGTRYRGERVGLDTWSKADNIGHWHNEWHGRLEHARNSGEPIQAWVNPRRPGQAVLDRQLRWQLVLFRLPFAILFTGVGVVAAWTALAALLGRPQPAWPGRGRSKAPVLPVTQAAPIRPELGGHRMLWLMALAWLLISVPIAASAWPQPGGARWLALGFCGIGVGLLVMAWRETQRTRRYGGARLLAEPLPLRTGQAAQFRLRLPASAMASAGGGAGLSLRLGMQLVDDSGSSRSTRLGWEHSAAARTSPLPDGGSELQARFDLPADSWPTGAVRQRERVQWQLALLDARQRVMTTFEVTVTQGETDALASAGRIGTVPADAWGVKHDITADIASGPEPGLPEGVQLHEGVDGWRLVFRRRAAQVMAVLAALGMLALLQPWWWGAWTAGAPGTVSGVRQGGAAVLSWLLLHWASSRWTLSVSDSGLQVSRGSWLVPRSQHLALGQLGGLFHKLAHTTSSGGFSTVEYHALWARTLPHGELRLTPGVPHAAGARSVAWQVQQAVSHRRGLSTPGQVRASDGLATRRHITCALTWLAWLAVILWAAPGAP
jgi:hypothetical protein